MGNRVKTTTPEGKVVQYSYDEANRLIEVASFLGIFDLGYDKLGRRTSLALPNGITTGYGYDAAGRLTQILAQAGGRRGRGEVVNAFTYTHDAVGNRLSKAVSMNDHGHKDATYQYTYDAVYQLLQSLPSGHRGHNGQEAERYTYDPVGNRLTGPERKDTYRYNTVNELVASRKTGFRYDYNGNMVARGEWTYEYDYENRLTRATKADGDEIKTITFKYDPFGRRIEKKVEELEHGKTKARIFTYVYDNEDIILEYRVGADEDDSDQGKVKVSRFVHGPGIDEPLAIEQKGKVYYYHADGLGSIVSLTDSKGRVVESFDYSAFGFMQQRGGEVKQSYAYTGREWDKELGLYYYRARYYDPVVGRFISKDPIGFNGGDVNLYRYVQNDPVNWVDPLGLEINIPNYINWMNKHAGEKSKGKCAKYVRQGLEAGGADTTGHPEYAKDYDSTLNKNDFTGIPSDNYTPSAGDTVVFQPYKGGSFAGHIQTYNGTGWVSDFKQKGFFPAKGYENSPYKIYRPSNDSGQNSCECK